MNCGAIERDLNSQQLSQHTWNIRWQ